MKDLLPEINFTAILRRVNVAYTATLPVRKQTVLYLSSLPQAEPRRRSNHARHRRDSPRNAACEHIFLSLSFAAHRQLRHASRLCQIATSVYDCSPPRLGRDCLRNVWIEPGLSPNQLATHPKSCYLP